MPTTNHHAKLRNTAGILALAVVICGGGLLGCTQPVDIPIDDCGEVMIQEPSLDANNTVMEFITSDCSKDFVPSATEGMFVLTIDIVADDIVEDGSVPRPRVLFTLEVSTEDFSDLPISLNRGDIDLENQLAPALYQEIDLELASQPGVDDTTFIGPVWSSTSGTIGFTQQDDGTILGEFTFGADSPPALNNSATGTLQVSGNVTLNPVLQLDTPCGMTSVPLGVATLLGLSFLGWHRRRRRA